MYDNKEIKRVQDRLLKMALVIRDIMEAAEVRYFITAGTILGAVRHNGFIPWDDDFDFYVYAEDYESCMSALAKNLPSWMFLEDEQTEPLYFHAWAHVKDLFTVTECHISPQDGIYAHKGLSIDLYKATFVQENDFESFRINEHEKYEKRRFELGLIDEMTFRNKLSEIERSRKNLTESNSEELVLGYIASYKGIIRKDEIEPLNRYYFEGEEFFGPRDYNSYLTHFYGNYMALPTEEKRIPHYSSVIFLE